MNDNKQCLGNNVVDFKGWLKDKLENEITIYSCGECECELFYFLPEGLQCSECEAILEGTSKLDNKDTEK